MKTIVHALPVLALLTSISLASSAIHAQTLYVSDTNDGTVLKIKPDGSSSVFVSRFSAPVGLTFDTTNNLYVIDSLGIFKITPDGTKSLYVRNLVSTFHNAHDLVFDTQGNLYFSNNGNSNAGSGFISKVTPNGDVSIFAQGFYQPYGLTFDATGNLLVADGGNNRIAQVTPAGVVSTYITTGLDTPVGLTRDSAGNLYYGNTDAFRNFAQPTIGKITPDKVLSTFASVSGAPDGLAFDPQGNLYTSGTFSVFKITPDGNISTFASGFSAYGLKFNPNEVPEPGSIALFIGMASVGIGIFRKRQK